MIVASFAFSVSVTLKTVFDNLSPLCIAIAVLSIVNVAFTGAEVTTFPVASVPTEREHVAVATSQAGTFRS